MAPFLGAAKDSENMGLVELIVGMVLAAIIIFSPLVVAIVAGYRAFKGRTWSIPLVGRIATHILAR